MLYVLGEAALRTALLAGILQSMLSLLQVRRTRLLLAAWTIVLATSLTMPLLLRSSPVRIPLDDAVPRALIDSAAELMQQPSLPAPAGTARIEAQMWPSLEAWLETAYIVVGCGLGLRALLGVGLSLRILARATPACPEWAAGFRVRFSRDVAGPVTIARTIVLPTDAVEWPTDTRQAVLAHEHAHVARMDYAMLVVSQLNRAMFWFSPLSWWLHRKLAALTELVSDDQAIEITRDRVGYAETLLTMAQRSGPIARGPSMARFSMLPLRIDRILNDQVTSSRVGRWEWATLTLGVVTVSLIIANFAPSIVLKPIATDPADLNIQDVEIEKRTQEAPPGTLLPPDRTLEPTVSHAPFAKNVAPSIARTQPARVAIRPHSTVQAPTKSLLSPPTPKTEQVTKLNSAFQGREASPVPDVVDQKKTAAEAEDTRNIAAASGSSVARKNEILYPRETTNAPLRANVERLDGSTCVGTVAVGMRAYYQGGHVLEPNVTAGQIVPAKAQFFRKADGSSWVRFGSFERPPLDLKVQPTRTGVTWTGEYGITYAVQEAGGDHLVGLAAKVANDSAALSFTCKK